MPTINNTYGRIETAEMIATAAIVFVRKARAEGYANKLNALALDGIAQELGIDPKRWTWSTVIRIVKANAELMGETHLLDLDPAEPTRDETPTANAIPASAPAVNLYAEDGDTSEQAEFRRDMARLGGTSNEVSLAEWLPLLAANWERMGGMEGAPAEFDALMARARTETRIAAFPAIADRLCALWRGDGTAESRETPAPREWKRIKAGHYVRYASDGTTVQARIVREPELRAGGFLGPDRWTAWILPSHGGWNASRPGLRTIKDAQSWIDQALPEAEEEIEAKRAEGQLIEQIVCGDDGDEMGCADCATPKDDSWPYGSDVCGECWDRALAESKDA